MRPSKKNGEVPNRARKTEGPRIVGGAVKTNIHAVNGLASVLIANNGVANQGGVTKDSGIVFAIMPLAGSGLLLIYRSRISWLDRATPPNRVGIRPDQDTGAKFALSMDAAPTDGRRSSVAFFGKNPPISACGWVSACACVSERAEREREGAEREGRKREGEGRG
jgi:hypothetical protein